MKQRIGILTMQWANNYGGLLQCYALSQYLNQQGYNDEVVNYWPLYALKKRASIIGKEQVIREYGDVARRISKGNLLQRIRRKPVQKCAHMDAFRAASIRLSDAIADERSLKIKLSSYDTLIAGSDQIWNPLITGGRFDDAYFINFDLNVNKVAYAASTGIQLPEKLSDRFFHLISKFDSLSVRENSLSELLEKRSYKAPVVLDPVFLLKREEWEKLAVACDTPGEYILVYTLEMNRELIRSVNWIQKKLNIPLIVIGSKGLYRNVERYAADVSVGEFLYLLKNAKCVVTNSFHGTAFSLIFKKNFFAFPHSSKPGRMVELLRRIGLSERIVYKKNQIRPEDIFELNIDYTMINSKLSLEALASEKYLHSAIGSKGDKKCIDGSLCSGCTACYLVCPKQAIAMEFSHGFYHAKVDDQQCIHCGLCRKVCPQTHKPLMPHRDTAVFAVKNKSDQVRRESSSGGFSAAVSDYIIKKNGVVYGVRYKEEDNTAVYIRCDTAESVSLCRQSKYMQADVALSFEQVKHDLCEGIPVLFTGVPCHIQGLVNYLDHLHVPKDNLITADIICHGTPSPAVFQSFVEFLEKTHGKAIRKFEFRDKTQGWRGSNYRTFFDDGTSVGTDYYSRAWNKLFALSVNDVCFQCQYACPDRISDFTMGDFWGIETSNCMAFEDSLGVSFVLCSSQKGRAIFQELKDSVEFRDTSIESGKKNNPLFRPTFKVPKYDAFWGDYRANRFEDCLAAYCYYKGLRNVIEKVKWFLLYRAGLKNIIWKKK